jgi:hypothetical protein
MPASRAASSVKLHCVCMSEARSLDRGMEKLLSRTINVAVEQMVIRGAQGPSDKKSYTYSNKWRKVQLEALHITPPQSRNPI